MRPTRAITASLAAVLTAATLGTPAIARPIDFPIAPNDAATRTSPGNSSQDAEDAPCASGLRETTPRRGQNPRSPGARDAAADTTRNKTLLRVAPTPADDEMLKLKPAPFAIAVTVATLIPASASALPLLAGLPPRPALSTSP